VTGRTWQSYLTWDKAVLLLVVLTVIVGSSIDSRFGSGRNFVFVIEDVGEVMIIAFAMTLIIITGEIDLSVASIAALASCSLGWAYDQGAPMWLGCIVALAVGAVCGAFNGFLVTKVGLNSLAVTIGTLALFRGLCWALLGDTPVAKFPKEWTKLGSSVFPGTHIPYVLPLLIVLGVAFGIVLHATRTGRWIFAVGQSVQAARFAGIPTRRLKARLFVVSGLMAGLAGIVYTMRFASARPDGAVGLELLVIASCLFGGVSIFGGVGTMWGVAGAVLFLGSIRSLLRLQSVPPNALTIITGGLLLASVIVPELVVRWPRRHPTLPPAASSGSGGSDPAPLVGSGTPGSSTA
jgi:rhamnose transport system permease protein